MRVSVSLAVVVVAMVVMADVSAANFFSQRQIRKPLRTSRTTTEVSPTSPSVTVPVNRLVDCADHRLAGATTSGVYEIYPFTCTCTRPVLVWCDMETDGGGWTVFLNRQNHSNQLDFNRTWAEYKEGFGYREEEHYLGNDVLYQMTSSRAYTVRLDMELTSGTYEFATYESFRVHSEDNRYKITQTGQKTITSSNRDCLTYLNGRFFTTIDRDHDSYNGNCAAIRGGGWWYYNTCKKFSPTTAYTTELNLYCAGHLIKLNKLQMKLRPAICDTYLKIIHLNQMDCVCMAPER